jgi:hypothetical protein
MRHDFDILTVLDLKKIGVGHEVGDLIVTFLFIGERRNRGELVLVVAFGRLYVAEGRLQDVGVRLHPAMAGS